MRLLVGGYTADMDGHAAGISTIVAGAADEGSAGGALSFEGVAALADSPSWVAAHPSRDVIYAALEHTGAVQAYRRIGEAEYTPLGAPAAAGVATCHIAVAPGGGSLIASCWGDGRVVHIGVDAGGMPLSPTLGAAAADPYAAGTGGFTWADAEAGVARESAALESDLAAAARSLRAAAGDEFAHLVPGYDQAEESDAAPDAVDPAADAASAPERVSRAHSAVFLPDGRVATADLGFDLVRFWRVGTSGLRLDHEVVLPHGSGPRHMVLHKSGHLHVVTEYSCEVYTLASGRDGRWRLVGGTPLGALPGDSAAELTRSHDGQFLYAGLRGSNTIAALRVRGAGESTSPVALVDAGVNWPRHHTVARDTLLVAGQLSEDVVSITLDIRTGVPGRVRHRAEVPSPTCLLPIA